MRNSYSEIGVNTVKYLDEGLWNMVVPKAAPDEVVVDLTEGISQVQQDCEIPPVSFFCISHHEVQQLRMLQNPILAVGKIFLDIIVMVIIVVQKGLLPISD